MEVFTLAIMDARRSGAILNSQLLSVNAYFKSVSMARTTAWRLCKMGIDAHFAALKRLFQKHQSGTIQISFDGISVARRHDLCLFIVSTQVSDDEGAYLPTMALPQVLKLLWTYKYSINSIVLRLEHESYIFFFNEK